MRFIFKIFSAAIILTVLYFAVDVGRYFFYPDVAKLKKSRPAKTAFMEYREDAWRQKGEKKK